MGNSVQKLVVWDPFPESLAPPNFDPQLGFPAQRKKRVSLASEEDMVAAKIPQMYRDYCAHLYIDYARCFQKEFPMVQRCKKEVHHHQQCEYEDFVLRMKEYERERRLLIRQKRMQAAAA
ncbi:NADH dehydrogenase [ubiquinone] 1 beta subcomplex subunit 7 [Ceratina calcarata]|uniref:NADH dehydrogenase [ubiquinone] 1 beta subcomplex subunit 7 n=1 Tax=Ceratina calcarata TaxID=156304 RepID=A0AAJ7J385_9HYME|nr:NADH dehydrogenase [ubiquinone] 1 beta subcomplex subunit 7 [Ceratina calcarata]